MNKLWIYPYPDWIFENDGNTTKLKGLSFSIYEKKDLSTLMKSWDWNAIIWKRVRKGVFNLQKRIYKATKAGKFSKAKSLMRLLQYSTCNTLYAVRRVTTDNKGKRTAGVDAKLANTPDKKIELVKDVLKTNRQEWKKYKPLPARRVMIPKANGKQRPLGIPSIKDRAIQASVKNALEPYYEAKFESCSYGFRPGMNIHDAIEKIAGCLIKKQKWVLDADIKGCFDNIDHKFLLNQIRSEWKQIVKQWLKAGYINDDELHQTEMGTPQGGTISPLLANIALDQMETDLMEHLRSIKGWKTKIGTTKVTTVIDRKTKKAYPCQKQKKLNLIRYADDFVVLHEDKDVIEESKTFIDNWLKIRGLTLSEEKTKVVHSTDGFDFLGHHIRHYENKIKGTYKLKLLNGTDTEKRRANASHILRVEPMKEMVKKHWEKISEIIGKMNAVTPDQLIRILQPKITGWANVYRTVLASEVFAKLDMLLWKRLYQWALRRHNNKGKRWVADKYFGHSGNRNWMFMDKASGKVIKLYSQHKERTGSYARVGFDRSYYDGDVSYWVDRMAKGYGDITPSKAKMLRKQDGRCPHCGDIFTNEDLMEVHHKTYKSKGGDNKYHNLVLLHRHCHDALHRETSSTMNHSQFIGGGDDQRVWY